MKHAPRIVRLDDIAPQPWRNGAGRTRELLAWPDPNWWSVRVSVADIEAAAPFSSFPGVERWFAVLEGVGVVLRIDQDDHRLAPGAAPVRFDGDASVACKPIAGPTRDLNLMLRGGHGTMHRAEHDVAWSPAAAQCGLFAAVSGRWMVDETGDESGPVPALSLLWFEQAPASLRFRADAPDRAGTGAPIGWWLAATPENERGE